MDYKMCVSIKNWHLMFFWMLESLFIFLEEMVIKYVEEMLQNDNFIIIKIIILIIIGKN